MKEGKNMGMIDADKLCKYIDDNKHRLCITVANACNFKDIVRMQPIVEINGETSDGYHTFNELYHHRAVLFSVVVSAFKEKAWKSKLHHDGTMYNGMFIVGVETPDGQATYHYDVNPYWDMFDCKELECAPVWDGHSATQAIERIGKLKSSGVSRTGEWLLTNPHEPELPVYECSACGRVGCIKMKANYCGYCGSKNV